MRDTYGENDLRSVFTDGPAKVAGPGMRHSIRPRRLRAVKTEAEPVEDAPAFDVAEDTAAAPVTPEQVSDNATEPPAPRGSAPSSLRTLSKYVADPDLPRWHELARSEAGSRRTADTSMPVVDAERDSVTVRAFDLLRTRLRQTTQEKGWSNIAVCAPTSGCGTTFTAVNLALSLSRISASRTVLMDFNLRAPSIARAFDMSARGAMRDFLTGDIAMGDHMVRVSDTLALGLNNTADANAADTLQLDQTARTLERMRAALQPDLVIYDMPAMLAHDDISAFLPQLDGVLLVSDGTKTMGRDLLECERRLEGRAPLLGVVLNRARGNSIPRYN